MYYSFNYQFVNYNLGGHDDDNAASDEIIKFDPQGQWRQMNRMTQPRSNHAVSAIQYDGELWNTFECLNN